MFNELDEKGMKRFIAMVLLAALTVGSALPGAAAADRKKVNTGAVTSLVREYNVYPGFEVVSVGGLGLGLVRMIAKASAETEEDRQVLEVLDGLRKVIVVEYEDADDDRRDSFNRKAASLLENAEKIVEVKEDGETLNVYATSASGGERLDDLIVFIPEDCTLICLFGSISSDKIADIIEMEMN